MPFCASCGAQVEGRFCPKCGAAIVAGGGIAPAPVTPPGVPVATTGTALADNVAAMLCYLAGLVTGVIFLVLEPYSRNRVIRFHAFQSIFLSVTIIAIDIVIGIFFRILLAIAGFFGLIFGVVWPIFGLACFILWLYMLISTYQGKTIVLPLIGPLAQKQAAQP